jgi:hypothetical protein
MLREDNRVLKEYLQRSMYGAGGGGGQRSYQFSVCRAMPSSRRIASWWMEWRWSRVSCELRLLYSGLSWWIFPQFFLSFREAGWDCVHLVHRSQFGLLYQSRLKDGYAAVDGMRIGRGKGNTRSKPAPVPMNPPWIPHNMTWDRTRAAAVGSRRLIAWAMGRPRFPQLVQTHAYMASSNRPLLTILESFHGHRMQPSYWHI